MGLLGTVMLLGCLHAAAEATAETRLPAQAAALQGYGEVQRMQAPQPDICADAVLDYK